MASLLISRVNNLEVIQVGTSKLSLVNKSEDGSKTGASDETRITDKATGERIGWVKKGETRTVDLGRGDAKISIRLFSFEREKNDSLFKIFSEERFCKITDKFKGELEVFVDSVDVIDSDSHINRTIYDISCTIQSAVFVPSVNVVLEFKKVTYNAGVEIASEVTAISINASSVTKKIKDDAGKVSDGFNLEFADEALNILRGGIGKLLDVRGSAFGALNAVKSRINTAKRLFETLQGLKDFPNNFINLLKELVEDDDKYTNKADGKEITTGSLKTSTSTLAKSEIMPIIEPLVRGEPLSKVDVTKLSQFEVNSIKREVAAAQIVNKVKVVRDLKLMQAGGFNSQADFIKTVESVILRLEHVGYTANEIADRVKIIKDFANKQEHRVILIIDVKERAPLVSIVFERYGNLDNYDSIRELNGLADNDLIQGNIKIFA